MAAAFLKWQIQSVIHGGLATQSLARHVETQTGTSSRANAELIQNISPYYTMMLLVECFAKMQGLSKTGSLELSKGQFMEQSGPVAITQILVKILSTQDADGGWGVQSCTESTAYALIALRALADLPFMHVLHHEIRSAIAQGFKALSSMLDAGSEPHDLWVGKIAASSQELLEAYVSAAMRINPAEYMCSDDDGGSIKEQTQRITAFSKFFSGLKHLSGEKSFVIKGSILEATYYKSLLKSMRTQIFPQTSAKEADKYLDYIPTMWILSSACRRLYAPPEYLFDMMVLSMFVFLVDEYMESTVAHFSEEEFVVFEKALREIHPISTSSLTDPLLPGFLPGLDELETANGVSEAHIRSPRVDAAILVFRSFALAVMKYPRVSSGSQSDLLELRSETQNYLLYHIMQLEDNARLAKQECNPDQNSRFQTPRTSYATWLHTIGAGHISGPWAFAFLQCLLGGSVRGGADCFTTVKQKLMAYNMNRHIGSFSRMFNDYGSVIRDRDERNLNSINFPEFFFQPHEGMHTNNAGVHDAKATLLAAARYERKCANDSGEVLFKELEAENAAGRTISRYLQIYLGACEQFADMYLTRDVTNRVTKAT